MEPPGMDPPLEFPKNPLLCPICRDYFTEPCILSCYHTFCARCLRGREQDRRLICPFCRQPTLLKDGSALPPPDILMRQLIDIANSENPPCSNCDKRDRANMYYCNTCGQALCAHCRDNTHRAKMFSSHEVVHMTKCTKEPKRCSQHGEQYIMYSTLQNTMLCVNCFRDLPNELRTHCLDIDTAHAQAAKRLERGQTAIMDLQTSVRDGIIALKNLMDELRRNMDGEKHTINTFCQGMQEAMAKTHAAMIMEVQRQFESKDRIYRSQLLLLGTVMPVLQLHLVLCTTFTSAANKYQFLELCPSLIERLAAVGQLSQPVRALQSSTIKTNYRSEFAQCLEPWIGPAAVSQHQSELMASASRSGLYDSAPSSGPPLPPPTKKQQTSMKNKLLEGETSFSAHCRSFESQIRELNQQFNLVKEKVSDLHRDISALRKAQNPPLTARYDLLMRECLHLDQSLERQQQELDRMATAFDQSWEEQLWRLRVEQEVFSCQRADVMTLRNELKHISQLAGQLEPYIRSLTPSTGVGGQQQQQSMSQSSESSTVEQKAQQMQSLLDHIGILQQSDAHLGKIPRSRSRVLGQLLEKVRPNILAQERERSKSAGQTDKPSTISTVSTATTPTAPGNVVGGGVQQQQPQKQKKSFLSAGSSQQQMNIDRLEAQIKEKLHDMMCRRQSAAPGGAQQSKSDPEIEKKLMAAKGEDRYKLSKSDLDSISKLGAKQRIMYKKIGKSCDKINSSTCGVGSGSKSDTEMSKKMRSSIHESDYQRISDATSQQHQVKMMSGRKETRSSPSSPKFGGGGGGGGGAKVQHKMKTTSDHHHHQPQSMNKPHQQHHQPRKQSKVYPYSDGEDNVFYSMQDSADSMSTSSRRSSFDGPDKTLVVVINRRNKNMSMAQKQRSWETFPPKRRSHVSASSCHKMSSSSGGATPHGPAIRSSHVLQPPQMPPLRKADSFEGHEEAVKSLVAAVQETRRKPKGMVGGQAVGQQQGGEGRGAGLQQQQQQQQQQQPGGGLLMNNN